MRTLLWNPVVVAALWIAAVAATIIILGPVVAFLLGRRRIWADVHDDPARAEPGAGDPDYQRRYDEVVALGFRPIGATQAHARFLTPLKWRWSEVGTTRWLASSDDRTFFFMDRALAGEPVRLGVATFFEGGGVLYLRSPAIGMGRTEAGNYARLETHGSDPRDLLSRHAEEVEAFRRERGLEARRATLPEASAEMMAAQKAMLAKQKGSAGLIVAPLALFGIPAMNAFLFMSRVPRGLVFAPTIILGAALIYAVLGFGLTELTRRWRLRESHQVDLNQKAAAPDGTIVDTGKHEAWVRRIAAFGALITGALSIFWLSQIARAMEKGSAAIVMLALFLFLGGRAAHALVARARGRAARARRGGEWQRNEMWWNWFLFTMISSAWTSELVPFAYRVRVDLLFLALMALPALGYGLDRAGRQKTTT
jgi:cbb3-type cytochrome oxidase subunit 3